VPRNDEIRPWSSRLGLNYNDREPFFRLKLSPLKAMVRTVAHIDVKTGSPDPVDFALARLLIQVYP
jgi:hypothetical protein